MKLPNRSVAEITGLTVRPKTNNLVKGSTRQLTAQTGTEALVAWSSDDVTVATVKEGLVTAIGEGSTKINIETDDGRETSVTVNVSDK